MGTDDRDGERELERFRAFVQASSDVVYRMNADWSEMRSLQGRDFLLDTNEPNRSWLEKYIHPDDQQRVLAAIRDAIEHKKPFELEHRVLRVDGSLGWTFSRAIPFFDANSEIIEWLGAASDVTVRKQVETALLDADQRKDEFLATLSHELRNPLAALLNGMQVIRLRDERPPPKVLQIMERQLDHLVRLVDDLLEVSRITRGVLELRKEPVELATIARDAVEASNPLIQAGGHRLEVAIPDEPIWLQADRVRLTQVLGNLLNNAAKYTDQGGQIALSARRDGHTAIISVRDNGCGIASPERVFDMFARESHARSRSQGGLGIGLTLARRLVEIHGGTIQAHSEGKGRGSEVVVRLPVVESPVAATAASHRHAKLPELRVLVVDDDTDAADSLGMILQEMGAEVAVVNDGPAALETFASSNPAVILLDIGMPGMNGYEVARALRTRFPERRPTLVALTGWGQPEDRRRAREAGFDHHLVKPAPFERLRDLLSDAARR